jgi:hypothetical protein
MKLFAKAAKAEPTEWGEPRWQDLISEDDLLQAGRAVGRMGGGDMEAVLKVLGIAHKHPNLWYLLQPGFRVEVAREAFRGPSKSPLVGYRAGMCGRRA